MLSAFRLQIEMNPYHQRILAAINRATEGMDDAEMDFHSPGKWSAAMTLEHLSLAFSGTARVLERCLAEGKPIGDTPGLKQKAVSFLVTDIGYFPEGRQAPKQVVPPGTLHGRAAVERIRADLARM